MLNKNTIFINKEYNIIRDNKIFSTYDIIYDNIFEIFYIIKEKQLNNIIRYYNKNIRVTYIFNFIVSTYYTNYVYTIKLRF